MTNTKKIYLQNMFNSYKKLASINYIPKSKKEINSNTFELIMNNLVEIGEVKKTDINSDDYATAYFNYMSSSLSGKKYLDELDESYQKVVIDSSNQVYRYMEPHIYR